jgi:hypothetical protein
MHFKLNLSSIAHVYDVTSFVNFATPLPHFEVSVSSWESVADDVEIGPEIDVLRCDDKYHSSGSLPFSQMGLQR